MGEGSGSGLFLARTESRSCTATSSSGYRLHRHRPDNSRAIVLASAGLAVLLKVVNSLFTLASCRIAIKPPDHHGAIYFVRARQKLDKKIRRFDRGYLDGHQLPGNPVPPAGLLFESRPDGGERPRLVSAATVVMNCDLVDLPRSAPRADYAKPRPRNGAVEG